VVIWPKTMLRFRKEVMGARLIAVHGRVQRSPEGITHLVAEKLEDWSSDLAKLSEDPANPTLRTSLARADEIARPVDPRKGATAGRTHPRNVRVLPASRDFH
jgi:error-prone DNA polymerase